MSNTAQAQSVQIGPGGVRITPDRDHRHRGDWRISEREAVRIARRQGIVDVNRVARAGREWRVSGINRRGHSMRVIIDARSGRVLRTVRMR
ncbi:PepSY domain-containing protein [Microvirga massiliensis]|uniref:PepSY domain-containing protein n=1 Tax=Microvirga massiliensis TaxID=1033741 RepID=UPI00062BE097|nr:PepSY domain-containing protein [Microvirga massiliensis]